MDLKSSKEWMALTKPGTLVIDPDGWDRKVFEYSWEKEPITKEEFEMRFYQSTVQFPMDTSKEIWA